MVEVQVRLDHLADIFGADAKVFQLSVYGVLAFERVGTKSIPDSRPPVGISAIGIGDRIIDPSVPEINPCFGCSMTPTLVGAAIGLGSANATSLFLPG